MNQYFKVILYIRFKLCKQIRGKTYNFEGHLIHVANRKSSTSAFGSQMCADELAEMPQLSDHFPVQSPA